MQSAQTSLLTTLEPIAAFPSARERTRRHVRRGNREQGLNPFRMNVVLSEQLLSLVERRAQAYLHGWPERYAARWWRCNTPPIVSDKAPLTEAVAMTDIQILRIDADLLDIMLTWDQLAGYEKSAQKSNKQECNAGEWMDSTGVFSTESLKNGIFRMLPPANVEEMFRRMQRIPVQEGRSLFGKGMMATIISD